MADLVWSGFLALSLIVTVATTVAISARFPGVPVFLIFLVTVRNPLIDLLSFNVAGISLYFSDFVSIILLLTSLVLSGKTMSLPPVLVTTGALFILIATVSLIRGVGMWGLPTAANEFREIFGITVAALWAITVATRPGSSPGAIHKPLKALVWVAVSWIAIRSIFDPTVAVISMTAQEAALLAIVGLVYFTDWLETHHRNSLVSFLLLSLLVFISVQRTATFALIAALLIATLFSRSTKKFAALVIAVVASVMVVVIWLWGAETGATRDALDEGNWTWRVSSWQSLLGAFFNLPAIDQMIGQPYGSGWERQILTVGSVQVSAHSMYITVLLRLGAIGLALYVSILLWGLLRAKQANNQLGVAGVIYVMIFGIGYQIIPVIAVAAALALGPGRGPLQNKPTQKLLTKRDFSQASLTTAPVPSVSNLHQTGSP